MLVQGRALRAQLVVGFLHAVVEHSDLVLLIHALFLHGGDVVAEVGVEGLDELVYFVEGSLRVALVLVQERLCFLQPLCLVVLLTLIGEPLLVQNPRKC